MGHTVGKDVYRELGRKIDNLHVRAPWNEAFHEVLKDIYSQDEADLFVRLPYLFSSFERIKSLTKLPEAKLRRVLDSLCHKGLVMDVWLDGAYRYMPSPLFVGVFEFTMMRTQGQLNSKEWGKLFHQYMVEGSPYRSNFAEGYRTSLARALPHEESLAEQVEILDYERAEHLVEESTKTAVGLCSCRHKAEHAGEELCEVPMETCTTLGWGADYLIRNGMSREIDRVEAREIFARSRELGLCFSADNVRKRLAFICHCCGCCCGIMHGLNQHGLSSTLVTSSFIAEVDENACVGCGKCVRACPPQAITFADHPLKDNGGPKKLALLDPEFCVGCGVCGLKCDTGAIKLHKRKERVIHPETTFERVILQCLERGTLQNQLFDNPQSLSQKAMRPMLGAFLRLEPVKQALMSDALRSTFLKTMSSGIRVLGKGYLHEL